MHTNDIHIDDIDSQLIGEIPFYSYHKSYLPFIGKNYFQYRILMVGESHYINDNTNRWGSEEFKNWWEKDWQTKITLQNAEYLNTREVVNRYINDGGSKATRRMFGCPLKVFNNVVIKKTVSDSDFRQLYNSFAFMNFFQIPSFKSGKKFWESLKSITPNKTNALELWNYALEYSIPVFDNVIDIIEPKMIIITSIDAGLAYINSTLSRHRDLVKYTSHPNSPYSWNKPLKNLGMKKGVERLEEIFNEWNE